MKSSGSHFKMYVFQIQEARHERVTKGFRLKKLALFFFQAFEQHVHRAEKLTVLIFYWGENAIKNEKM